MEGGQIALFFYVLSRRTTKIVQSSKPVLQFRKVNRHLGIIKNQSMTDIDNACIYYADCFDIIKELHFTDFTDSDFTITNVSQAAYAALYEFATDNLDINTILENESTYSLLLLRPSPAAVVATTLAYLWTLEIRSGYEF
jgi:hypothetical protein